MTSYLARETDGEDAIAALSAAIFSLPSIGWRARAGTGG